MEGDARLYIDPSKDLLGDWLASEYARWEEMIWQWPKLSGEAKRAWWRLLLESDFGNEKVSPDDETLGGYTGGKRDAGASRRSMLEKLGAIRKVGDQWKVIHPVELYEESEQTFRVVRHYGDHQRELFDDCGDPRGDPRSATPIPKNARAQKPKTNPSASADPSTNGDPSGSTHSAGAGGDPRGDARRLVVHVPGAGDAGKLTREQSDAVFEKAYEFKRMILELPNPGIVHMPYLQALFRAELYTLGAQQQARLSDEITMLKANLKARKYDETAAQYVMGTIKRLSGIYGFPLPRRRE